jgi:hypothetical protein
MSEGEQVKGVGKMEGGDHQPVIELVHECHGAQARERAEWTKKRVGP